MKLKPVLRHSDGAHLGYAHWCAGCSQAHVFYTTDGVSAGHKWSFDGNMDTPTFTPSMRFFDHALKNNAGEIVRPERTLCHYNLTKGVITYHADSTDHELRGDHPMQDIPADYGV